MDAMIIGYPADQAGQISITATTGEWSAILEAIRSSYAESNESEELVTVLQSFGVL